MSQLQEALTDLRDASVAMLAARAVALLGAAVFLLALVRAGHLVVWVVVVLAVLAGTAVLLPDSEVAALMMAIGLWAWWAIVPDPRTWWALPGAVGLLLLHVGTTVGGSYPPTARLPRASAWRWTRRTGVVAAVTVAVCLVGQGLATVAGPSVLLTALAFAVVLAAVLLARHASLAGAAADSDGSAGSERR